VSSLRSGPPADANYLPPPEPDLPPDDRRVGGVADADDRVVVENCGEQLLPLLQRSVQHSPYLSGPSG
jgi:hypothetical protein